MSRRASPFIPCVVLQVLGLSCATVRLNEAKAAAPHNPVARRAAHAHGSNSLPRIDANDNRAAAGQPSAGVLRIRLEARLGRWYPQADEGPSEPIEAFAEEGHKPSVPGPLVRGRTGTRIEITIRNTLAGKTLVVYGLHARPGSPADTVQIAPGAVRQVRFIDGEPGTYFYWASTGGYDVDHRDGIDSQLSGAIVVDSASPQRRPRDRAPGAPTIRDAGQRVGGALFTRREVGRLPGRRRKRK